MSLVFKKRRIVRMVDAKRTTLVYLTYSDRLIDANPYERHDCGGVRSRDGDTREVTGRHGPAKIGAGA